MSNGVKAEPNSPGFEDDVSLSPSPPPSGAAAAGEDGGGGFEDDEEFEDSLDLDMSGANAKVWLVRLPKFLMDRWKNKDPNGEALGKVLIRDPSSGSGSNNNKRRADWQVRLELNDSQINKDLPKSYDINLTKQVVENTFAFTEKDLPKYKKAKIDTLSADGVAAEREVREKLKEQAKQKGKWKYSNKDYDKEKHIPFVRTIPKKTALVGTVCHECAVQPDIHDPNYQAIIGQRREQLLSNPPERQRVTLLENIPGVNAPSLGGGLMSRIGENFMKAQKRDPKNTEGKATRMPKNELLDVLFKLFEEYEYWSMRGLRERTHQPEQFLKETLASIAVLNKKGPFAMRWSLKPEFKQIKTDSISTYMTDKGIAVDQQLEEDEEDEDEEMETVDLD